LSGFQVFGGKEREERVISASSPLIVILCCAVRLIEGRGGNLPNFKMQKQKSSINHINPEQTLQTLTYNDMILFFSL
jgi:hypothetical protein